MSAETVGPSELADALGISERHVYRLHGLGMPKDGRGAYPLVRCARWYRRHVLSPGEDGDGPDLGEARLRKVRGQAVAAERELARRREEVIRADTWDAVEAQLFRFIGETVRAAVPAWARALEGADDARVAEHALRDAIAETLVRLQEGPTWERAEEERRERKRQAA